MSAQLKPLDNWRLANRLVRLDPLLRRTFREATRILVTPDTLALLPSHVRHKAWRMLAIGLPSRLADTGRAGDSPSGLRLLYAGRLLSWKGVDIALRAVSLARQKFPDLSFTIVGDGPDRAHLERLCHELQLDYAVHWAGWMAPTQLARAYQGADALLFPSLRDSGGMVVLEALANGVPVLCTDLGGPGMIVNFSCGRSVATAGCTREELASQLADAIVEIATVPGLLDSLRRGAKLRARAFSFADLVRFVYPDCHIPAMESRA